MYLFIYIVYAPTYLTLVTGCLQDQKQTNKPKTQNDLHQLLVPKDKLDL